VSLYPRVVLGPNGYMRAPGARLVKPLVLASPALAALLRASPPAASSEEGSTAPPPQRLPPLPAGGDGATSDTSDSSGDLGPRPAGAVPTRRPAYLPQLPTAALPAAGSRDAWMSAPPAEMASWASRGGGGGTAQHRHGTSGSGVQARSFGFATASLRDSSGGLRLREDGAAAVRAPPREKSLVELHAEMLEAAAAAVGAPPAAVPAANRSGRPALPAWDRERDMAVATRPAPKVVARGDPRAVAAAEAAGYEARFTRGGP
jgi:hypothetical protein